MKYSFDRPSYGWEGLNNGGEIYGGNGKRKGDEVLNNASFRRQDDLIKIEQDSDKMNVLLEELLEDKPYINRMSFKEKKECFLDYFSSFSWIKMINSDDINKIIELYEKKALNISKDPWDYVNRFDKMIMLQSVYDVIKDNSNYKDILEEVVNSFEKNLNKKLLRTVYSYGEETDKKYRGSYALEKDYSLTLAEMCIRKLDLLKEKFKNSRDLSLVINYLTTYETIRKEFLVKDIRLPEKGEKIYFEIKSLVDLIEKENMELQEKERIQKEKEQIKLKQKIVEIENEIKDIKKNLYLITSGGKLFSSINDRMLKIYPEEYKKFKVCYNQVSNYKSTYVYENDLNNKFLNISSELDFYKNALNIYLRFNDIYEQISKDIEDDRKNIEEVEKIKGKISIIKSKLDLPLVHLFSRKYPEDYKKYKISSDLLEDYNYINSLITTYQKYDFYRKALRVYEDFIIKYEKMVVEVEKERKLDKGIGAIKEVINKINSKVGTPISFRISRKYPEEYKTFSECYDKLHDFTYINNFKDKWEEYEFYEKALQVYGKFNTRYEQMVVEVEEERNRESEKKKILDLIYSDEKLGYKLLSSNPIGVREIPEEFRGISYEQVKEVFSQRKEKETNEQIVENKTFFEKKDNFVSTELTNDDKRNVLISKTLEKMFPNGALEEDLMSKDFSQEFIKAMNDVELSDLNQTTSRRR